MTWIRGKTKEASCGKKLLVSLVGVKGCIGILKHSFADFVQNMDYNAELIKMQIVFISE